LSSNFDTDDEGGPCRSAEEQDASGESSHEELCRSVKRMRLEQATLLHFRVPITYICVLAMLCNTCLICMLSLMSAAFCLNKPHLHSFHHAESFETGCAHRELLNRNNHVIHAQSLWNYRNHRNCIVQNPPRQAAVLAYVLFKALAGLNPFSKLNTLQMFSTAA